MNMFARQSIKSPEYHHMICIGKTKCTSEKGLLLRHFKVIVPIGINLVESAEPKRTKLDHIFKRKMS